MTIWLRVTEIARMTNLSRRYWQRRFARGEVPGSRQIDLGQRRLFVADRRSFTPWWTEQLLTIAPLRPKIPAVDGVALVPISIPGKAPKAGKTRRKQLADGLSKAIRI